MTKSSASAEAPGRYARWLREKQQAPAFTAVSSLDDVAAKLQARNPSLHERWRATTAPEAHPLLTVRPGDLEPWERP